MLNIRSSKGVVNGHRRKAILGAMAGLALVVTAAAWLFIWPLFRTDYPPTRPDFNGYRPVTLPAGLSMTQEELSRNVYRELGYSRFDYLLGFNGDEFRLYERRTDYPGLAASCSHVGSADCREIVSAGGTHYRVVKALDPAGKVFHLDLGWSWGDTEFYITVSDTAMNKYLDYDWTPFVDSFAPVDLGSMKAVTRTAHCCGG